MLGFIPSLGLAVVLYVGGRQVISGNLTLGEFTAFYTYLIMLMGPMRMLGMALGMAQRAVASGNRLFEILDREPRITSAARRAAAARRARAGSSSATSPCATTAPRRRSPTSASRSRRGARWRSSARPARARPASSALIARLYDPSEGAVLVDGADVRSVDVASLRGVGRLRRRRQLPVLGHGRREHRLRAPGRDPRGDRDGGAARAGARVHHPAARRLRDAWSASAG